MNTKLEQMFQLTDYKWYRKYKGGLWYHFKTVSLTRENVDYWCRPEECTLGVLCEQEYYE